MRWKVGKKMPITSAKPDLAGIVRRAEEGAAAAKDPELQRVAFVRLLDHLLNAPADDEASTASSVVDPLGSPQQRLDEVSMYFQLEPERVNHLVDLSTPEPRLLLTPDEVPGESTVATRRIAILATAIRSALGLDTTTVQIRDELRRLERFDAPNFSTTLTSMPQVALLGESGQHSRVVRLTTAGVDEARKLVQELTSG